MALLLAEEGYRVFAAGRNAERREELAQIAGAKKLPIQTIEMDVTDDASVDRALAEVRTAAGPLDALVNNAGIGAYAVAEELSLGDLRRTMETNFFGVVRVTQRVLPEMRERRRGRIVQMSSLAGRVSIPLFSAYSASKFALEGWSDALRLEVYPFGIHVALIEPGVILTSFQATARALSADYWNAVSRSPYAGVYEGYNRTRSAANKATKTTPEDCARMVLRALRETPPRPRYTVTPLARQMTLLKRLLTDRMLDRQIVRRFGLDRVRAELQSRK
jgi:NAD(P)-dependent dehydrogenase (short-subunit alcohol dehydrogenase family)